MPASTPFLSFQTDTHWYVLIPTKPKSNLQPTISDSHIIVHTVTNSVLSLDFLHKVNDKDIKIEPLVPQQHASSANLALRETLQEVAQSNDMGNESLQAVSPDAFKADPSEATQLGLSSSIWFRTQHVFQIIIPKCDPGKWSSLEVPDKFADRDALIQRRREATERRSAWEKEQREQLRKEKIQDEKRLFDQQWGMEKERRANIDRQKKEEDEQMRQDIKSFTDQQERPNKEEHTYQHTVTQPKPSQEIFDSSDAAKDKENIPKKKTAKKSSKAFKMFNKLGDLYPDAAPVRKSAPPVIMSFTPRVLRSAARQDKDAELLQKFEIWKKKNRPDRLEDNPAWIKQRGDKFFQRGDFLAAINAYTAALEVDPDALLCYANRAACHLNRQEFSECIEDCNRFLITRPDETSSASNQSREKIIRAMVKVFARRGSAHFHIGEFDKAMRDYEMAIQMDQEKDPILVEDFEKLKQDIEKNKDTATDMQKTLKGRADVAFQAEDYQEAIDLYSRAIHLKDSDVYACRSNRAACYLKLGSLEKCVTDCTFIIDHIFAMDQREREQEGESENREPSNLSQKKRTALTLKAYVRRGTCYSLMGDFKEGYADYTNASRMAPHDDSLLRDMEKIDKRLQSQIHADWYKNRGNFFFKQGEYETAIRSYDLAVKADDTNPVYFSNRAQCHMKLQQYLKCIRDIDAAFNARIPQWHMKKHRENIKKRGGEEKVTEVDAIPDHPYLTSGLQLKLFVRRATCYKYLDEIQQAYMDYLNASRLDPNNKLVKEELNTLKPQYQEIVAQQKEEQEEKAKQEQADQQKMISQTAE